MRFINVYSLVRLSPLTLFLLLAHVSLHAQDTAGNDENPGADDELQGISLQDSKHVNDPVFEDDVPEDLGPLPEAQPSDEDRLMTLFKLYRDAVNDAMYAEADTLAKQIVELTISMHGVDSSETARAITNLAIAQHGSGQFESAKLNFNASVEIIERISDRLNEDLINPLKGLAASELALGNTVAAAETFQRAMHVSHVNFGPHNLEQLEMLESLAETYLAAGDLDGAVDMQERIFSLQARNIDPDSEDILPALENQASWLHRLQLYDKERYTWRRIISVLENHRGRNDLSLIPPLTGLGNSYLYISLPDVNYFQPTSNTTGEIYLKRALRIAEENPRSTWQTKSQAMVSLADYYILTDKPSRAERLYRDAWEVLSSDTENVADRQSELQTMQVLQDVRPPKFYGLADGVVSPGSLDSFETGTIVFQYSVSSRGKPVNITLIEAKPEGLEDMERSVARELRRIVQRPRIVDGETVQTDNLTYTHNFYYRESDLPESLTAADATSE
jgi:tetratricopeptide (TPR) repeat protein